MTDFSAEELGQLAYLVPAAQRLVSINDRTYKAWVAQLSDHERTILLRWVVKHSADWRTATVQEPGDAAAR